MTSHIRSMLQDAGYRVNNTQIPEFLNGIYIIPNKPKDGSSVSWGVLTFIVVLLVIVVRILKGV